MSTTVTQIEQSVPTGTWTLDTTHSSVGFAVKHAGISLFKGEVQEFDASLVDGTLRGSADVTQIKVDDENLAGHLLSPDFFDVERFPQVSFTSTELRRDGDQLVVEGELEIRGTRQPVRLTGTISGPVDLGGTDRIGIGLEATIDRTHFGITWNMELPSGGVALENEVKLSADLELVKAQ
jgi:polyisoprenoid-binding protein YceI